MTRASAATGVPLNVLYSVGLTETGRRGELEPYDMNIDGREVRSQSLAEALARFAAAQGAGREAHRHRLHADQRPLARGPFRLAGGDVRSRRSTSAMRRTSSKP